MKFFAVAELYIKSMPSSIPTLCILRKGDDTKWYEQIITAEANRGI
jgi:hypothetical protein